MQIDKQECTELFATAALAVSFVGLFLEIFIQWLCLILEILKSCFKSINIVVRSTSSLQSLKHSGFLAIER